MSKPEIHHVVFDIGNVLVRFTPEKPFRHLISDSHRRDYFLKHVCNPAWNKEQDRGRPWPQGEALLIKQFPEFTEEIRLYRRLFHEMVSEILEQNVSIMRQLIKNKIDVTLLTNAASDTLRDMITKMGFLVEPRGITISGDLGLIKPDHRIYKYHAENYSLDPVKTLFIDDSSENIKAAQKCGWHGIILTPQTDLKNALDNYDLKSGFWKNE